MRKISQIIFSLLAVMMIAAAPALPAQASAADDVNAIITEVTYQEYEIFDTAGEDTDTLAQQYSDYAVIVHAAADELNDIDANSALKEKITNLSASIDKMADISEDMAAALRANDEAAFDTAYADFMNAYNETQTAISDYNAYMSTHPMDSGDSQYMLWFGLLVFSLICLAGAIILVVTTRNQHGATTNKKGQEMTLKKVRANVLLGAIIFVVGAAIPAVQYWWGMNHANEDGTFEYYIFFWPLILGVILFVAGLIQYLSTYMKLKKSGKLAHKDNAAEMAQAGIPSDAKAAGIKIPKIGSKADKK